MEHTSKLVYTREPSEKDIHKIVDKIFLYFDGQGDERASDIQTINYVNENSISIEVPALRVNAVIAMLARLKWFEEFTNDVQESIIRSIPRQ